MRKDVKQNWEKKQQKTFKEDIYNETRLGNTRLR